MDISTFPKRAPWPRGDGQKLLTRLPSFLKEPTADGGERVRPDAKADLPEIVFVDPTGRVVPEGKGVPAALIRRNFLFCLEPSCGVAYAKTQRSERAKLATLGVDNEARRRPSSRSELSSSFRAMLV